jgi:hypothetical protein
MRRRGSLPKPDVETMYRDERHRIIYHVWAHRPLTRSELMPYVRLDQQQNGVAPRGTERWIERTLLTKVGLRDPIDPDE